MQKTARKNTEIFERFFAQNYSKSLLEWILTCFLEFEFLTQSDDFAKAIGFA